MPCTLNSWGYRERLLGGKTGGHIRRPPSLEVAQRCEWLPLAMSEGMLAHSNVPDQTLVSHIASVPLYCLGEKINPHYPPSSLHILGCLLWRNKYRWPNALAALSVSKRAPDWLWTAAAREVASYRAKQNGKTHADNISCHWFWYYMKIPANLANLLGKTPRVTIQVVTFQVCMARNWPNQNWVH